MSVLASVEKRLEESEQRLTELIQHLERHNSLEKSLDEAGRGIGEASNNLGELASSTRVALESLKNVVDSLQETLGILERSNPAETVEAVARIEKQLEVAWQEVRNVVVKELEATRQENKKGIDEIEATLASISDQQSESQNRAALISYITLALVFVVVGIEAIRFFL